MSLYPRYVKMADGSKVLVQGPTEHAALTGVAKGESAKALMGHEEPEPAAEPEAPSARKTVARKK